MFNVEHYLLLLSVVSYEGVDGVTVGHPADETRVGGEGDDRVALNAARIEVREEGGGTGEEREEEEREEEGMEGEEMEGEEMGRRAVAKERG